MRLTVKDIQERIHERCPTINAKPVEKFTGENTKFEAHCTKCGHSWVAQARTLMIMRGCKYCRRLTLPKVRKYVYQRHPHLRVYGHIHSEKSTVIVVCLTCKGAGRPYKWRATVNNLMEGKGCKYCENKRNGINQSHTFNYYRNLVNRKYHNIIDVRPLHKHNSLKYRKKEHLIAYCKRHHFKWITTFDDLLDKTRYGCPVVSVLRHRTPKSTNEARYIFKQWYHKQRVIKILSGSVDDYINNNTIFDVQCLVCGTQYQATAAQLRKTNGHGCPHCAYMQQVSSHIYRGRHHLIKWYHHEHYLRIVHWPTVLANYNNNRAIVLCICLKCGYKWKTSINHLLNGQRCPMCTVAVVSHGENTVEKYLKRHGLKPQVQKYTKIQQGHFIHSYRLHNTRYWSKRLHLDFLLNINNRLIGIEFDGMQHFVPVAFNGHMTQETVAQFHVLQKRDRRKNKYCHKHHIHLIRIENTKNLLGRKMHRLVKRTLDKELHIPKDLYVKPISHQMSLF